VLLPRKLYLFYYEKSIIPWIFNFILYAHRCYAFCNGKHLYFSFSELKRARALMENLWILNKIKIAAFYDTIIVIYWWKYLLFVNKHVVQKIKFYFFQILLIPFNFRKINWRDWRESNASSGSSNNLLLFS